MSLPRLSQKEAVILELLASNGEMYGLELVDHSGGRLKRGTVYVTLGRMEDKGLVRSRLEERLGESGPARRLYEVTSLGYRMKSVSEAAEQAFHQFRAIPGAMAGAAIAVLLPLSASAVPSWIREPPFSLGLVGIVAALAFGMVILVMCIPGYVAFVRTLSSGEEDSVWRAAPDVAEWRHQLASYLAIAWRDFFARDRVTDKRSSRLVKPAPGTRLRSMTKAIFTKRTNTLVFDPLLADFELEYLGALAKGAAGQARWIRVKYTSACFAAMVSRLPISMASLVRLVLRAG